AGQRPSREAFAGLYELFAVGPLPELPAPQLRALWEPADADPHALRLGVLNALRALAAERPLLVGVDDVATLDAPSGAVLAFAARRLEDAPVRFLLTRAGGDRSELEQALLRPGLERLPLGPLPLDVLRRAIPDAHADAGGNPRLAQ